MENAFWTLAIGLMVFAAGIRGWCRRFTGQVCAVTGLCIASLSAHLFSGDIVLEWISPFVPAGSVSAPYVIGFLSAASVYVAVYAVCVMLTGVVRRAMTLIDGGIVDSLFGALFGIFNGLIWLSMLMNVWLCLKPEGELLHCCASDDANAPQSVLLLAPWLLGSPDAADLHHAVQLRDARKISANIRHCPDVISEGQVLHFSMQDSLPSLNMNITYSI